MSIPPRPTSDEYLAALERIHARRRRAGDDHPLALSEDPREVLAYLRKRGRSGLVSDDTGDDIIDALTLRLWLWWEGEAAELWLLEAAEALRRPRRPICERLGFAAGQSIVDRIRRTLALLGRTPTATTPVAASSVDGQVRALAAALVRHRGDMPDDIAEDLHLGVIADALPGWAPGTPPPTEGVLNAIRFLLGDLDDETPAGAPLRAIVDHGIELVGTRG